MIGAEFLPHLDEGAIWARGTLANSTSLSEGEKFTNNERLVFASHHRKCQSRLGGLAGPTMGPTSGLRQHEISCVDLKPKDQWRPVFHQNKDALIAAMNREVQRYPGRGVELLAAD